MQNFKTNVLTVLLECIDLLKSEWQNKIKHLQGAPYHLLHYIASIAIVAN